MPIQFTSVRAPSTSAGTESSPLKTKSLSRRCTRRAGSRMKAMTGIGAEGGGPPLRRSGQFLDHLAERFTGALPFGQPFIGFHVDGNGFDSHGDLHALRVYLACAYRSRNSTSAASHSEERKVPPFLSHASRSTFDAQTPRAPGTYRVDNSPAMDQGPIGRPRKGPTRHQGRRHRDSTFMVAGRSAKE